jgi:RHS repeat-associated protein
MTYDFNGNLRTLKEAGQTTTYTWDVRDRLIGIAGSGLTASFGYDASDRRTSKTLGGFATTHHYDILDIVLEIAGGSTVNYLRGLGIDEHLARIEDGSSICYAPDALGSTMALTDGASAVTTEYSYEPFGRTTPTGPASQNAFQFTGRENDGAGLYFYRARYYNSQLGRFLAEDPIGLLGGPNRYVYVRNNPATFIDPYGLQARDPKSCAEKAERWRIRCLYESELNRHDRDYDCKVDALGIGAPSSIGGGAAGILVGAAVGAEFGALPGAVTGAFCSGVLAWVGAAIGLAFERDCTRESLRGFQADRDYCNVMADTMKARGCDRMPPLPGRARR